MARMKLEGQLDVVEYYRITEQDSAHMGDHAGGSMEMLKEKNSAREYLMTWSEKKFRQEQFHELMEGSKLKQKEYNTVRSSEVNEKGLEQLLKIPWRVALKKYFNKARNATSTVAAYLAYPCLRTELQVRLTWCLMYIKRSEYEASNDSRSKEQELQMLKTLRVLLITTDDFVIEWAKRKDALCFVRFVVDRIPTPVLE